MVYIYAYAGGRFPQGGGCGSSEINLTQVPIPTGEPPGVILCTFILAFANDDGQGNFKPQWDTDHYSAQNLAGVKAALPTVNFALSLGGGNPQTGSWPSPGDQQTWISNAVNSIKGIMQEYGLDGVDVDYETGLDDTFVPVMTSLIPQINPAFWSLAPDNQNLDTYLNLYNAVAGAGVKPTINFQAYSMETNNPQDYIDRYTYIRNNIASFTDVGFGIDTNTAQPRGMQYPDITNLCFSQFEQGSTVPQGLWNQAMVWSIEDSCQNGYPVERTLSGPPPAPPS
jgi:hypothetical protein